MLEHVVPFCPAHMVYYCIIWHFEVFNERIYEDDVDVAAAEVSPAAQNRSSDVGAGDRQRWATDADIAVWTSQ